jgi:hypothetical protein
MLITALHFFSYFFTIQALQNQIIALCLQCQNTERCLRGRKEQFAKLSYWKRYRGFESRSLRYDKEPSEQLDGSSYFFSRLL